MRDIRGNFANEDYLSQLLKDRGIPIAFSSFAFYRIIKISENMAKGFIMLSKEFLDDDLYKSERFTRAQAFIDLCYNVEYKERTIRIRGCKIDVKPGQVSISLRDLALRWKWSVNTVVKFLNELKEDGYVDTQKTPVNQLITIKKYLLLNTQIDTRTNTQIDTRTDTQIDTQIDTQTDTPLISNNIDKNIKEKLSNEGKKEKPLWKESYDEYKRLFLEAKENLLNDSEFRTKQESYYPNIDFEKSIDKNLDFWLREDIWEKEKRKKTKSILPAERIKNNFDKNKIYKPLGKNNSDNQNDEEHQVIDKSKPEHERFAAWVEEYYPCISDTVMPTEEQYLEMKKLVNGDIQWACDMLQDDHHTGSLYDLFKERFGNNR